MVTQAHNTKGSEASLCTLRWNGEVKCFGVLEPTVFYFLLVLHCSLQLYIDYAQNFAYSTCIMTTAWTGLFSSKFCNLRAIMSCVILLFIIECEKLPFSPKCYNWHSMCYCYNLLLYEWLHFCGETCRHYMLQTSWYLYRAVFHVWRLK